MLYSELITQSLSQTISYANDPKSTVTDDLPPIEDIMNCLFSKFIYFAANDCGCCGSRRYFIVTCIHSLFLKAKLAASKDENPNWRDVMESPFKEEFWKAVCIEVETLEGMDSWDVVDHTDDMNILQSIWAFKIKCFPDGLIKKFKAYFCACGYQQLEGIDFFKTYAPVVLWTTMRLLLILEVY